MKHIRAFRVVIALALLAGSVSFALASDPPAAKANAEATPASRPPVHQVAEAPAPASREKASDAAPSSASRDRASKPADNGAPVRELVREGSRLVDEVGTFRLTGDRATFFYQEGKMQINALENLALERVARLVGDTPDQLEWSVSGTVTEYRGNNYLLITRAVIKRKASRTTAARYPTAVKAN